MTPQYGVRDGSRPYQKRNTLRVRRGEGAAVVILRDLHTQRHGPSIPND